MHVCIMTSSRFLQVPPSWDFQTFLAFQAEVLSLLFPCLALDDSKWGSQAAGRIGGNAATTRTSTGKLVQYIIAQAPCIYHTREHSQSGQLKVYGDNYIILIPWQGWQYMLSFVARTKKYIHPWIEWDILILVRVYPWGEVPLITS
jgi:hypothetical protein